MEKIVTKDWLKRRLENELFNQSTQRRWVQRPGRKVRLASRERIYIATGTLPEWLAKVWLVEKAGYPRICKYVRQLNEIASAKKHAPV